MVTHTQLGKLLVLLSLAAAAVGLAWRVARSYGFLRNLGFDASCQGEVVSTPSRGLLARCVYLASLFSEPRVLLIVPPRFTRETHAWLRFDYVDGYFFLY